MGVLTWDKSFSYWVAECLTDSKAYSIREKSKAAAKAVIAKNYPELKWNRKTKTYVNEDGKSEFGELHKVTIEYDNTMDLIKSCLGEGGGFWE